MLIAVTGTPGTGKSHFAKRLFSVLGSGTLIEINDIVERQRLFSGVDKYGTKIVKMGQLNAALKKEIKKSKRPVIVSGHLAADLDAHYDICVVTRAKLSRLTRVFKLRGYDKDKARENLFAEALDYCGVKIGKKADEVYEVETQKEKKDIILYIKARAEKRGAKKPKLKNIDKMPELLLLIEKRGVNL